MLIFDRRVPVEVERVDLGTQIFDRGSFLLFEVRHVLTRGLKQVFGAIQFVHKTLRGVIAFQSGEIFAVARFIGGGCLFLLLRLRERLIEIGELVLSIEDGLELRFGIGSAEHSVEETADELGSTRERVRELEARALRKLQRTKVARGLRVYARD